jgi:hypothetical protein
VAISTDAVEELVLEQLQNAPEMKLQKLQAPIAVNGPGLISLRLGSSSSVRRELQIMITINSI